jgi:hypothetical protein
MERKILLAGRTESDIAGIIYTILNSLEEFDTFKKNFAKDNLSCFYVNDFSALQKFAEGNAEDFVIISNSSIMIGAMNKCKMSACGSDAPEKVKSVSDIVCLNNFGSDEFNIEVALRLLEIFGSNGDEKLDKPLVEYAKNLFQISEDVSSIDDIYNYISQEWE